MTKQFLEWAGADVDSFIALEGQYLPLTQSYRIPAKGTRTSNGYYK